MPRFKVSKRRTATEEPEYKKSLNPDISYEIYQIKEIVRDLKESRISISESYYRNSIMPETTKPIKMAIMNNEEDDPQDKGPYELPDGRLIELD